VLLALFIVACNNDIAPKPAHLLSEDNMVNIFYDLSLLQAIKSFTPKTLEDHKIDSKNYIYKKYKTDSLTFAQNHTYYALNLEKYEAIQKRVSDKLKKSKEMIAPKKVKKAKVNAKTARTTPSGTPLHH